MYQTIYRTNLVRVRCSAVLDADRRLEVLRHDDARRRVQVQAGRHRAFVQTHFQISNKFLFAQNVGGRARADPPQGVDHDAVDVHSAAVNLPEFFGRNVVKRSVGHYRSVDVFEISVVGRLITSDQTG